MSTITNTFAACAGKLVQKDRGISFDLKSHDRVKSLKKIFSSVVVTAINIRVLATNQNTHLIVGVVPDTLALATTVEAALAVPHQIVYGSEDSASIVHTHNFMPPGLEYDLAAVAVRGAHPNVRVVHTRDCPAVGSPGASDLLCFVQVEVTVACSGAAFGI